MAKRRGTRKKTAPILQTTAPDYVQARACQLADKAQLPMTVFSTTDPEMPFRVTTFDWGQQFAPVPVGEPYRWLALVTFLPARYFVR